MILPLPWAFSDWKDWGTKLVATLSGEPKPFRAQRMQVATLQKPTEDGIVVLVDDAAGGPTLAVAVSGVFIDVRTGVAVV